MLEDELARLKEENRCLLNSLLTVHGHVGLGGEVPLKPVPVNQRKPAWVMAREREAQAEGEFQTWQKEVMEAKQ